MTTIHDEEKIRQLCGKYGLEKDGHTNIDIRLAMIDYANHISDQVRLKTIGDIVDVYTNEEAKHLNHCREEFITNLEQLKN